MSTQEHTQYPNDMSDTSKVMKSPNHATNPLLPLSLLPLSISPFGNKAPKRKAKLLLGWRRRSRLAGRDDEAIGVGVRVVGGDGRRDGRSRRRSRRGRWSLRHGCLHDNTGGIRQRCRQDGKGARRRRTNNCRSDWLERECGDRKRLSRRVLELT